MQKANWFMMSNSISQIIYTIKFIEYIQIIIPKIRN